MQLDRAQGIPQISSIAALTITAATRAMPIVSPSSSKPRHQLAIKVKTTLSLSPAMGRSSSVRSEPRWSCELVARLGEFPGITVLEFLEGSRVLAVQLFDPDHLDPIIRVGHGTQNAQPSVGLASVTSLNCSRMKAMPS